MSKSEELKAAWEAAKEAHKAEKTHQNFKVCLAAEEAYWNALQEEEDAEDAVEVAPLTIGDVISSLRTAAYRAESIGQVAASEKQISYLASLMVNAGHNAGEFDLNSSLILTKSNASKRIDTYLNH